MKWKLKYRIALPVTSAVVALLLVSILVGYFQQKEQTEQALHEQAYILSQEMSAIWDFVSVNQSKINTDSDGSRNFKGLHCSVAGTSVGALFSSRTDYVIRYVSDTPRNPQNMADELEAEALQAFREDDILGEYTSYGTMKDDALYYRYVIPLKMEANCESCHGFPVGEMDETGFPKEGMEKGDIVGAASIGIPMDLHESYLADRFFSQAVISFLAFASCLLVVYLAVVRYVVKPLEGIGSAVQDVGAGNFDVRIDATEVNAKDEMHSLVCHFNKTTQELESLTTDLEQKVSDRTAQLEKAYADLKEQARRLESLNEQLEAEDRYKSHYFTMMSHELRTPLTAIRAYVDILKGMESDDESSRFDVFDKVHASVASLSKLVSNILELAKLEAGKVELEMQTVDVVDVMGLLGKTLSPLARAKDISLYFYTAEKVPLFLADEDKLLHVIENLGSNAIKYTSEGGTVMIEAYHHRKDDTIRFAVIDDGIGIPPEEHAIIFEKFKQAESSVVRPVSGSGLGLALAKEYIELHGGSIRVTSAPSEGSIFRVILPCKKPSFFDEKG